MLSLSKKTDYSLIALAYLAERPGRVAPAREIAQAHDLPLPLLMNILKDLHQHGMLRSVRGTKGGYQIAIDPAAVSLHELITITEGRVQTTECITDTKCCEKGETPGEDCRVIRTCPVQAPLQALHHRLVRFLMQVRLSDLILPGHRIDVPLEMVGISAGEDGPG
jgi:Rrf2 family iron-sulfur cluster assembly transcriptional regulator